VSPEGRSPGAVAALIELVRSGERTGPRLEAAAREAAREAARDEARTRELFSGLIEPLSDSFEPEAVEVYTELFTAMIAELMPEFERQKLACRFQAVRKIRPFEGKASSVTQVFVLSRVTLGADIAVASIMMDAAKQAFPHAQIRFAGNKKNAELWAGDPRVQPLVTSYGRTATLLDRLDAARPLRDLLGDPGGVVIDPDSRLTQLGLIPVCPDDRYYYFDSRAMGGGSDRSLAELARAWAQQTFGVAAARAYVAPQSVAAEPRATVSFGVGENPAKRAGAKFEAGVLSHLISRGLQVVVDEGLGGEESERVHQAIAAAGLQGDARMETMRGPFAPFAARIAASPLYVGYDSSGQHVAAACGVPLVTVFAGAPNERFIQRWRPEGPGRCEVIRADGLAEAEALRLACEAINNICG
jgi:ADP-heptose:LPS heptosyltransferase